MTYTQTRTDAAVHQGHGQVMSFWQYLSPADSAPPGGANGNGAPAGGVLAGAHVIGPMLRDLHAELRPRAAELLTGGRPPNRTVTRSQPAWSQRA